MACNQPLVRVEFPHIKYLNKNGEISHKAQIYSQSQYEKEYEKIHDFNDGVYDIKTQLIPCGKCIGCRLDYSRQWANRGYLEAKMHDHNWFITLTYNDEHLPMKDFVQYENKIYPRQENWTGTLVMRDLQLFWKKLRKRVDKVRYLACGEYGGITGRPHYHAILFGSEFETDTFYNARYNNNNLYWQNKIIEECWDKGFSYIGEANWNTIAYVARYVTKKQYGEYADEEYAKKGREKEFITCSRNPGIANEYYNLYADEIYKSDKILFHNTNGNFYDKPPRYFDKLRERYDKNALDEVKDHRKSFAEARAQRKDRTTSLRRKQQMEIEERSKEERTRQLKRDMVVKQRTPNETTGYHAQRRSGNPKKA